jgi:uncharacterized membrane protein
MKAFETARSWSGPRRQRGAIAVMLAAVAGILLLTLAVIDIGFIYLTKREYQKAADLAAIAGARAIVDADGQRSCVNAQAAAQANLLRNLASPAIAPGFRSEFHCGQWAPGEPGGPFIGGLDAADPQLNALRARVSGRPLGFFMPALLGRQPPELQAEGTAATKDALAALRIRSSLAVINGPDDEAALVAGLCRLLVQASDCITVNGLGWGGLVDANVAISELAANIGAASVEELLDAEVGLGELLSVLLAALPAGPGRIFVADVGTAVGRLPLGLQLQNIRIGDLLAIASGTPVSELDVGLNVGDLVLASVQAATRSCALCAGLPVSVPGVGNVTVRATVIEPQQVSVVGVPALAVAQGSPPGSSGLHAIHVDTAQTRILLSVDVASTTSLVNGLLNVVTGTLGLGEIVSVLGPLVGGDLLGVVQGVLDLLGSILTICSGNCPAKKVVDTQVLGRIDIMVSSAQGSAYVTDYQCGVVDGNNSLDVHASRTLASVAIGTLTTPSQTAMAGGAAVMDNATLLDMGYILFRPQSCVSILGIGSCSGERYCTSITGSGNSCASSSWSADRSKADRRSALALKLKTATKLFGTQNPETLRFENSLDPPLTGLPPLGAPAVFQPMSEAASPTNLLSQLELQIITEPAGLVSGLLNVVTGTVSSLGTVLGALDPLLNQLLADLGVELNRVEVGANMDCGTGGGALVN